jgi:aspartate racemase
MMSVETSTLLAYFFVLSVLGLYGWHRYFIVYLYAKHKDRVPGPPPAVAGAVRIPLLSIIDVTVAACARHDAVGLLATAGCLRSEVYQHALGTAGIGIVSQTDEEVAALMRLIYRIKSGDRGDAVTRAMHELASALVARGAGAIFAGCTEIPLVLKDDMLAVPLVASTDILARQTVALARGE